MKNLLTGPTKCLLVRPRFLDQTFYNLNDVYRILGAKAAAPPLGLLIVAALLPDNWQLRLVDHDVTPLTEADLEWADIVFISGIAPQEEPMLEVVRQAKAKGKLTVVGGSGPTLQPDMYDSADFVVSGEGEDTVPRLLEDLGKGATRGRYQSMERADLRKPLTPRYDLAQLTDYMFIGLAFSRGCPFACEFCAQIEIFGREVRTMATEQVIAEMQLLYDLGYRGMIDFGYDNLIGNHSQAVEVLTAMRDWAGRHDHPFCYSTEATINLALNEDVLQLMKDNDFRYVFVGIESADDAVLEQTKKGQNTSVAPVEAVRIMNNYGLIVYTGLILGFDSETDQTAQNMLDMVQKTGAFPALVLPLHALPSTQLARRLANEERLFGSGDIPMNTDDRTDTATTGLNFATKRPRAKILRDLAHVLDQLYEPRNHYERVRYTARHLHTEYKFRPSLLKTLQLAKGFFKIAATTGLDKQTGPLFWTTLLRTMLTNRSAVEMVVGLSVMHTNYAAQSRSYIKALKQQADYVDQVGEEAFNAQMIAKDVPAGFDYRALDPVAPEDGTVTAASPN